MSSTEPRLLLVWATEDPPRDWPVVAEHLKYQLDAYWHYMVGGTDKAAPRPVDPVEWRDRGLGDHLQSLAYGTPEQVAEQVKAFTAGAPVETVFLWAALPGMSDEWVARNVQTICTRLAPLLDESQSFARDD